MTQSLARALRDGPLIANRTRAKALVEAWRRRTDTGTLSRLDQLIGEIPDLGGFLAAMFDGSSFLHELACRDPGRLVRLLETEPEASFDALMVAVHALTEAAPDDAALMHGLRVAKQEIALLCAIADLGGVWPCMRVTGALSDFAEAATRAALRVLLRRFAGQGRLTLEDPADPERGCGYFVLAMGKLGARELNYSSDIDLIIFYDRDAARVTDLSEHQSTFVRLTQALTRLLNEANHDGRVFRVDLRLRPDPGTYPLAISTVLARHYYEAVGRIGSARR